MYSWDKKHTIHNMGKGYWKPTNWIGKATDDALNHTLNNKPLQVRNYKFKIKNFYHLTEFTRFLFFLILLIKCITGIKL